MLSCSIGSNGEGKAGKMREKPLQWEWIRKYLRSESLKGGDGGAAGYSGNSQMKKENFDKCALTKALR